MNITTIEMDRMLYGLQIQALTSLRNIKSAFDHNGTKLKPEFKQYFLDASYNRLKETYNKFEIETLLNTRNTADYEENVINQRNIMQWTDRHEDGHFSSDQKNIKISIKLEEGQNRTGANVNVNSCSIKSEGAVVASQQTDRKPCVRNVSDGTIQIDDSEDEENPNEESSVIKVRDPNETNENDSNAEFNPNNPTDGIDEVGAHKETEDQPIGVKGGIPMNLVEANQTGNRNLSSRKYNPAKTKAKADNRFECDFCDFASTSLAFLESHIRYSQTYRLNGHREVHKMRWSLPTS